MAWSTPIEDAAKLAQGRCLSRRKAIEQPVDPRIEYRAGTVIVIYHRGQIAPILETTWMIVDWKFVEGDDEISRGNVFWAQLPQRLGGGIDPVLGQTAKKFGCDMLLGRDSARRDVELNVPLCCSTS